MSPSVYIVYQTVFAWSGCAIEEKPHMYTTTGVTFAYEPDSVSTRACNFPGAYDPFNSTWTRIDYNDLYHPPSNQVLSSRYQQCYPGSSAVDPERLLKSNGFTFPVLSLHDDLQSLDPAWKGCTPVVGAFNPPRVLQPVTTLNGAQSASTQLPKASPALKVTPLYASAPTAALAADRSSSRVSQQASPVPSNANPVASPTSKKASTVQADKQESVPSQPASSQHSNADHQTSNNLLATLGSFHTPHLNTIIEANNLGLANSPKPNIVPTSVNTGVVTHGLLYDGSYTEGNSPQISGTMDQIDAQASTKAGPLISNPPQSLHLPSVAGHEIHQAPNGGIFIGSITFQPGDQTTIGGNQLAATSTNPFAVNVEHSTTIPSTGALAVDIKPSITITGINTVAGIASTRSHTSTPSHTISVGSNRIVLDGSTYTLPPLTSTTSSHTTPPNPNPTSNTALTLLADSPTDSSQKPAALPTIQSIFAESPTATSSLPSIFSTTPVYESATNNTTSTTQASPAPPSTESITLTHTAKSLTSTRSAIATSQEPTTSRLFAPKTSGGAARVGDGCWVIGIAVAFSSWGLVFGV